MPLKRALVVDDSKVARVTLRKQLEKYHLSVALAESGEEALEFLETHAVDVIFMDHIMPGMDGLQTVSLIKSNPNTATIPVMMYTSKEGEVYVSEARALGAVGVLPKQVQHDVLFGMLLKLGLVRDRREQPRAAAAGESIEGASLESASPADSEPAGFEVSALMSRMLEDQQSELRSEIRSSYRQFARQIASEVHDQLREHHEFEKLEEEINRQRSSGWQILSGILALTAMLFIVLFIQARSELNTTNEQLARVAGDYQRGGPSSATPGEQLSGTPDDTQLLPLAGAQLLDTVTWALNESGAIPYGETPFNDARVDQITGLLWQLLEAGFLGTLRIDSHLGEFCLVSNAEGNYELQDPDLPFTSCTFIGHPLDNSQQFSDRQTPSFALFLDTSSLLEDSGIELDLVIRNRADSFPREPYPSDPPTAGAWNRIAALNNRLEYSLLEPESD